VGTFVNGPSARDPFSRSKMNKPTFSEENSFGTRAEARPDQTQAWRKKIKLMS
jgi:hypothetical protein